MYFKRYFFAKFEEVIFCKRYPALWAMNILFERKVGFLKSLSSFIYFHGITPDYQTTNVIGFKGYSIYNDWNWKLLKLSFYFRESHGLIDRFFNIKLKYPYALTLVVFKYFVERFFTATITLTIVCFSHFWIPSFRYENILIEVMFPII